MDTNRFLIRPAEHKDISQLTEAWYTSFDAPFFKYLFPKTPALLEWWNEAWKVGLESPMDKTFVVEDKTQGNRIVAFSRWVVPQGDGNLNQPWPDVTADLFEMDTANAFFGGMAESREQLMGKQPHWMLELLGTDPSCQRQGIASALIAWGTDQADKDGLPTYLDGSEKGQPFYVKHHGFEVKHDIAIPDRPEFGSFHYRGMVRRPMEAR